MGLATLAVFRSELLFSLKNRTDTSTPDGFDVTRQDGIINMGYLHVTHPSVFEHRQLRTDYTLMLVNGQYNYIFTGLPVTPTVLKIYSVSHVAAATDDPTEIRTKLLPHDPQWFQSRTLNPGGRPRDYCIRGNELLLSPVPGPNEAGQVLVVSCYKQPDLLLDPGDTTEVDFLWDEVVMLAARWRAELHLGYRDLAELTKLDLAAMINEYSSFGQLHGEEWDWQSDVVGDRIMESV